MSSTAQVALLIGSSTALFVAFLRAPQWCMRSLHRHRLWRLRDEIADDLIDGRLPKDHAAARELLRRAELAIEETTSMLGFYVWAWVSRRSDPMLVRSFRRKGASFDGLSSTQRERIIAHRECLGYLSASSVLTGTWVGLATILRFVIPAIKDERRRSVRPRDGVDVRDTLWLATDKATHDTTLGRRSNELMARDLDARLAGVV